MGAYTYTNQGAPAQGDGISFFTKKTRLWKGRSQIIFFQIAQPVMEDRYYSFQLDEKLAHLLIPPRVLKGEKIGYLRVQALAEGKTQIAIEDAKIAVEILSDTATPTIPELNMQIVTPASGADVWGDFAVGVEQLTLGDPNLLPVPTLLLPNGKELAGHIVPDQKPGPHARWVFTVNTNELAPGPNELVAVQKDDTGREIRSNPLLVDAISPGAGSMVSGSCQDELSGDRPSNNGPPPKVVNDDKYGQGRVVDNGDEGRSWCLPVWIEKTGQYQMLVTARGEFGGDALPSLAVTLDEAYQAETTVRLATTEWQRIPVGHPITLQEGGHILNVRIRNGFSEGPDDVRNLYLQKYELVRVDPSAIQLASNNGSSPGAGSMMAMVAANNPASQASGSSAMSMVAVNNAPSPGAGSSMMSMVAANHAGGVTSNDLHVTFADNLDGQTVTGAVEVLARCWWPGQDHTPPPRVELFVNQKLVASQTSGQPRFTVDPAAFVPGPNTLELRAVLPSGAWAKSVPFTVTVPQDFPLPQHPFRPTVDFTTYDSALSTSITPPQKQGNPELATLYSDGVSTIALPDNLAGSYRILIEAKGDLYQGPPNLSVGLKTDGKETKLADIPVGALMKPVSAGQVSFAPGPKDLTIAFTNDLCDPGKGDRNLYVRAVHLVPVEATPEKGAPRVAISYFPKESGVGSVDAVVASIMDSQRVASADLLIDNQPQHLDERPLHGFGPVVFPLLTRDLKPGRHQLKVVAHDDAGNLGYSSEVSFTVSATATTALSKYERAVFLLNRLGYGPEPREVSAILTMGEQNWLASRLAQETDSPAERNEREGLQAQFPNQRDGYQVTTGAVEYLLTEPNPVRARFVMWAENHFSTWINKDGTPAKAREHDSFVQLGPVPFFDLLFTSATSPAMLVYLDQRNSYAHRLNENYAREIMELHTLGVNGGYTQKDVTTLADLLTGWTLADEAPPDGAGGELERYFGYDPHLNHGAACRVLGVEFPGVEAEDRFDRDLMALEMLSAHPSCATFISRKLCEQYVSDPAPPKLVDDLAQVYLETGGDISSMLEAMIAHPDFWSAPGKIASPIDFAVRAARMARSINPGPVNDLISTSGMGMFDRATPDGYPEDNGYNVNSNALLQRWRFAKSIQNDFLGSGLIPNSWRPADNGWDSGVMQRIVDLAAARMTGNVLSQASNDAAQKLLTGAPPNTDIRLHALTTFICQLPENSLK